MNSVIPDGLPQRNRLKPLLTDRDVRPVYILANKDKNFYVSVSFLEAIFLFLDGKHRTESQTFLKKFLRGDFI